MDISFTKAPANDQGSSHILTIDGDVVDARVFSISRGYVVHVGDDSRAVAKLRTLRIADHPTGFAALTIPLHVGEPTFDWTFAWSLWNWADDEPFREYAFMARTSLIAWANPWSFANLTEVLERLAPSFGFDLFADSEDMFIPGGVRVSPLIAPGNISLGEWIDSQLPQAVALLSTAVEQLNRQVRKDALFTFFEFPAAVSTACQQYLLYFVQFLSDLGIEANAEIKQDAQRVLFSVTPKEGPEALKKIQEALQVYLDLPASPRALNEAGSDMAVQQLKANVFHLQGQLAIAEAVLQAKDATIEATRLTAYRYRQMLLTASAEPREPRDPDPASEEPLVGEYVKVTPYKGKGFTADLPALLRMLKRKVGE